jgi:chemotaxis protein CheY-P-specific phosphatase CheC
MNNYPHPIALILIAGNSDSENQQLHETLQADEYVFASSTDLYNFLDIAECHHPKAVLVDFSSIEHNYLGIIQFLQFLQIPAIVLSDELQNNMIQYLSLAGVFATLKKTNNELELRRTLAMAAYPDLFDSGNGSGKSRNINLASMKSGQQTKLQDVVNKAIGMAVSQMSEMIACEIEYEVPSSQALSPLILQKTLIETLGEDLVAVAQLDFSGNLSGSAQMLFSREAADAIVLTLNGGGDVESEEFKQDKADIMGEIGNLAISGIVGTFSNTLKYNLGYVVPHYTEGSAQEIFSNMNFSARATIVLFMSHFKMIDFHVEGDFILFFQARLLLDLLFRV